jgi:hypothetical protein
VTTLTNQYNSKLTAYIFVFLFTALAGFSTPALAALGDIKPDAEVVLSKEKSIELDAQIPVAFQNLLVDETIKNPYFYGDESKVVESNVTRGERLADVESLLRLEKYDPRLGLWFYLPHLEIPMDDFEHLNISPSMSEEMHRLYFFSRGGKRYVRYFLHPFRELQNYHELIKQYPLKYDYLARPISSPRSMVVIPKTKPLDASWVKVSLGLKMSALQRRQKPEKLARALMVNEALELIPQERRDEMKLSWLNESFAAQLPGKEEVIIGRDVKDFREAEARPEQLRSTFSFFHSPDGVTKPEVAALIEKSGLSEVEFFKKYFLTPAIKTFIDLAFNDGLQWSMHTGNYYTKVDGEGIPTGDISIKDFDGAAFDPEMRMLRGKSFAGIHGMTENPFSDAWFVAASGRGTKERQRMGYVYSLYLRDVYGFNSIASYMFSYLLNWGGMQGEKRDVVRKVVEEAIDEITIEAVKEITGIEIKKSTLARGQGENAGINIAYNQWRDMHQTRFTRVSEYADQQEELRTEFIRLMNMHRAWTDFSRANQEAAARRLSGKNVVFYYHENAGMIQVRSYRSRTDDYTILGYALIEDPKKSEAQKDFLRSIGAKQPTRQSEVIDENTIKRVKLKKSKFKMCGDLFAGIFESLQNTQNLHINLYS